MGFLGDDSPSPLNSVVVNVVAPWKDEVYLYRWNMIIWMVILPLCSWSQNSHDFCNARTGPPLLLTGWTHHLYLTPWAPFGAYGLPFCMVLFGVFTLSFNGLCFFSRGSISLCALDLDTEPKHFEQQTTLCQKIPAKEKVLGFQVLLLILLLLDCLFLFIVVGMVPRPNPECCRG